MTPNGNLESLQFSQNGVDKSAPLAKSEDLDEVEKHELEGTKELKTEVENTPVEMTVSHTFLDIILQISVNLDAFRRLIVQ